MTFAVSYDSAENILREKPFLRVTFAELSQILALNTSPAAFAPLIADPCLLLSSAQSRQVCLYLIVIVLVSTETTLRRRSGELEMAQLLFENQSAVRTLQRRNTHAEFTRQGDSEKGSGLQS